VHFSEIDAHKNLLKKYLTIGILLHFQLIKKVKIHGKKKLRDLMF
jgi:hypothetical protein